MSSLEELSDYLLVEAYYKALETNIGDDFLKLLVNEMHRRKIDVLRS